MTTQNQNIMKILIAPDKFKGSLTSSQAAEAIREGIRQANADCRRGTEGAPELEFRTVEIADGGDGSLEVLQKKIPGANVMKVKVHDPLGRKVDSQIMLYSIPGSCQEKTELCAFIEMAKVSGLEMLSKSERNPLNTSTYGMGEAIRAAVDQGAGRITLSIGGSATNDGGAGMLQALGYRFFNAEGGEISAPVKGGELQQIASIAAPGGVLSGIEFKVICDVTNPLLGPEGATAVYGPQKGADARALGVLEAGLANYAAVAERCMNVPQECKECQGAGAAGGVGYAGLAFLGAELIPGWKFFAQITSLEESVQWADLVITGEGSLDSQSLSGKVVSGVLNLAAKYNKEVVIFCGVSKLAEEELKGIRCYSIASLGYPLDVCMSQAAALLQQLVRTRSGLQVV